MVMAWVDKTTVQVYKLGDGEKAGTSYRIGSAIRDYWLCPSSHACTSLVYSGGCFLALSFLAS